MSSFFGLVFLLNLIAMIVGLIKPDLVIRWNIEKSRKSVLKFYGIPLLILFVLTGATSDNKENSAENKPNIEEKKVTSENNLAVSQNEKVVSNTSDSKIATPQVEVQPKVSSEKCKKALPELENELTLKDKNKLFDSVLKNMYFKLTSKSDFKHVKKRELERLACVFYSLDKDVSKNQIKELFSLYIKNKDYQLANELSKNYDNDLAINFYIKETKNLLKEFSKNHSPGPYKIAKEFRKQAELVGASEKDLNELDQKIEYYRPVGDAKDAYNMCKDAVIEKLGDVKILFFEHNSLELMGIQALFGTPWDEVNDKVTILKIKSWVQYRNESGTKKQTHFKCDVTYDKKTEKGEVTKLSM